MWPRHQGGTWKGSPVTQWLWVSLCGWEMGLWTSYKLESWLFSAYPTPILINRVLYYFFRFLGHLQFWACFDLWANSLTASKWWAGLVHLCRKVVFIPTIWIGNHPVQVNETQKIQIVISHGSFPATLMSQKILVVLSHANDISLSLSKGLKGGSMKSIEWHGQISRNFKFQEPFYPEI